MLDQGVQQSLGTGPGAPCFPQALAHSSGCPAAALWALALGEREKKNAVFESDLIREGCKKQLLILVKLS